MRRRDAGLAHGTLGSPQQSASQSEYENATRENERSLERNVAGLVDETVMMQLERAGTKFSREDVLFAVRDRTGQAVWLERGGLTAGFEHMRARGHDRDLARAFGVSESEILAFLHTVIRDGEIIKNELKVRNGSKGYERIYAYNDRHVLLAVVGTNGFLITAYPR